MKNHSILQKLFALTAILLVTIANAQSPQPQGRVESVEFHSHILADNKIGLDPQRSFRVYLPPSYDSSNHPYPVLYYCHNFFWSPWQMFEDGNLQTLLEKAFVKGQVPEFILVAADYTSPTTGSLYENSSTSGRWLDYTIEEVIPFIDQNFRTLPQRSSRAVAGDFMGGRGALKLAMDHPDIFASVYALHPVATGSGSLPYGEIGIDWANILQAQSFDSLTQSVRERIFTAICQGFLPNPNRPPFYCDFLFEESNEGLQVQPQRVRRVQSVFHLDETLDAKAENLRSLSGIAFDWGRFDQTQAHVLSNRRFSRLLADLAIDHEAEEYVGGPIDKTWTPDGRFATRLLPFLAKHLEFAPPQ